MSDRKKPHGHPRDVMEAMAQVPPEADLIKIDTTGNLAAFMEVDGEDRQIGYVDFYAGEWVDWRVERLESL